MNEASGSSAIVLIFISEVRGGELFSRVHPVLSMDPLHVLVFLLMQSTHPEKEILKVIPFVYTVPDVCYYSINDTFQNVSAKMSIKNGGFHGRLL